VSVATHPAMRTNTVYLYLDSRRGCSFRFSKDRIAGLLRPAEVLNSDTPWFAGAGQDQSSGGKHSESEFPGPTVRRNLSSIDL
ncbi:MAG TPA: hypothetical protein VIJ34_10145, partial [Acidimicrobiales bacterium]